MRLIFVLGAVVCLATMSRAALADGKGPASRRVECMKARGARAGCTGFHLEQRRTTPSPSQERGNADAAREPRAPRAPDPSVDPRARLARREQRLLIRELAQLQRLFVGMRRKDPQRPQVLRRLAESYAELARASERRAVAAEMEAEAAKQEEGEKATRQKQRERPEAEEPERAPASPYPTRL